MLATRRWPQAMPGQLRARQVGVVPRSLVMQRTATRKSSRSPSCTRLATRRIASCGVPQPEPLFSRRSRSAGGRGKPPPIGGRCSSRRPLPAKVNTRTRDRHPRHRWFRGGGGSTPPSAAGLPSRRRSRSANAKLGAGRGRAEHAVPRRDYRWHACQRRMSEMRSASASSASARSGSLTSRRACSSSSASG